MSAGIGNRAPGGGTPAATAPSARAFLGLGANLGDPAAQIGDALDRLAAHPRIGVVKRSDLIVSRAWGKTDQPDFSNLVAEIATSLDPHALLSVCLDVEKAMGRQRLEVWGPRLIDIDVIAYGRLTFRSPNLTLPHPYAHARLFVLGPLRQIAPDMADWVVSVADA